MDTRSVVLVGPMGSGKSTVGRALAQRLRLRHVDTDDLVERRNGSSIQEIFDTRGEAAFRELETAELRTALDAHAVVSTGGGIVVTDENRRLLAESPALVVWLDGSIDALVKRVGSGRGRPLLGDDIRTTLQEKVAARAGGYLEVADLRVDTSEMRHADCVDAIIAALEGVSA
ncbi:MAG: shikimate kinase [Acidimicrobiales bacterium]|nr:MAG: shikimate kinase [Acidimicrobiales bacterium]